MTKKRITPEVRLTTNDFPDIMRREYKLEYVFAIRSSHDMREFLLRDLYDILANLETTLNSAIKEWCNDEG